MNLTFPNYLILGNLSTLQLWLMHNPEPHCHLKIFSATTKLTTSHNSKIATLIQLAQSGAPSFITARSRVLSAVSGNALMKG